MTHTDHLTIRESIRIVLHAPGARRPTLELRMGEEPSRSSGAWVEITRRIDRVANWYHEEIKDSHTGKVLRSCSEPLTCHTGRGSARRRE